MTSSYGSKAGTIRTHDLILDITEMCFMRQRAGFSHCKHEEIKQCRHHHKLHKHQTFFSSAADIIIK